MRFSAWCLVLSAWCAVAGCGRPKVERVEWPVMGTIAAVQTRGEGRQFLNGVCEIVRTWFAVESDYFNAYDPKSELSRLQGLSDEELLKKCNPHAAVCYAAAFKLREQSAGAFDPRWRGSGTLDMGAIAKGFAVDNAALNCWNGEDILIDLGGNLKAVKGDWTVGIKDGGSFVLHEGEACATSARYYRGDHIKDGRTGANVTNGVYSVTVIHPESAMLADGLSTTLFILGRKKGEEFLKKHYPEARAVWSNAGL